MNDKRLNEIEELTQLVDDQFINEARELIASIRSLKAERDKLAGVASRALLRESDYIVTLKFIADGCLVPPDGGSPQHPEDSIKAAREVLAKYQEIA